MGYKGIDVVQTGDRIIFTAALKDGAGAKLTMGSATYSLYEVQSSGALKQYDFSSNTFKTTGVSNGYGTLTHQAVNGFDTGIWTAAHTSLGGFTALGIYVIQFNHDDASPYQSERKFQFGGAEGDETVTSGRREVDLKAILGTALTEGGSGRLAGSFTAQHNVASPVFTNASVNQAGDSYARIGANGAGLTVLALASQLPTNFSALGITSGGHIQVVDALSSTERTAIANEVEAQIIDDTDSEKVLAAITDKIASVNPSLAGLTLAAIASSVWSNGTRTLSSAANITSTGGTILVNSGAVTVGTNNDKSGYALSSPGIQAIWDAATSALSTAGSIGKFLLDYITGVRSKTDNLPTQPAGVGDEMTLADEAISAGAFAVDAFSADAISAGAANKLADHARRRTQAHVEQSSDGDPLSLASEYGCIQFAQFVAINPDTGVITVCQTDGSTVLGTKTGTLAAHAAALRGVA